jgi:hypothetical protein
MWRLQEVVEFARIVLAHSLVQRLGEEAARACESLRHLPVRQKVIGGVP